MGRIEYDSNNSGGGWWLSDDDWKTLEAGGWTVEWCAERDSILARPDRDGRWLGALATSAHKDGFASMAEGVAEFERLTDACATDAGCPCCGPPHSFTFIADDGTREYGPTTSYTASF